MTLYETVQLVQIIVGTTIVGGIRLSSMFLGVRAVNWEWKNREKGKEDVS